MIRQGVASTEMVGLAITLGLILGGAVVLASCGLTCEERTAYAEDYVERVVASNQRCNVDDDCTNLTIITACGNMCAHAVNEAGVEAVGRAVDYVDEAWCDDAQALGCRFVTPTCPQPGIAWCDQGVCVND